MSEGKVEERPDQYDEDLDEGNRAGQHAGVADIALVPAYEIKDLHNRLNGFQDDDLKQIFVVAEGERLEQGGVYCDLTEAQPREFKAMGGMTATAGHYYVSKSETDYPLWNRLIGVDNPARTATGPDDV